MIFQSKNNDAIPRVRPRGMAKSRSEQMITLKLPETESQIKTLRPGLQVFQREGH
jgi:hypothetical protein